MRLQTNMLLGVTLVAVCSIVGVGFAQLASEEGEVQVTFQNTSTAPLALCLVDQTGRETVYVPSLAAGTEVSVNARPGNVWVARLNGREFAEYAVDGSDEQVVDLALEATWRLTVEVVLQNDTQDPVSLWMMDENEQPIALCGQLDPGQQWEQPGLATGSFLRVMMGNDVVAQYLTDNVPSQVLPLGTLMQTFAQSVTVAFQNTTTEPVDIGWMHADGGVRLIHPQLPMNHEVVQPCSCGHRWVILQGGEVIGSFMAGSDFEQTVDIGELAEHTLAAYDAIAAGNALPDNSVPNVNSPVLGTRPVVGSGIQTLPQQNNFPVQNNFFPPNNLPQQNKLPTQNTVPQPNNFGPQNNVPPKPRRPSVPPANVVSNGAGLNPLPPINVRTNPQPNSDPSVDRLGPQAVSPRFALDAMLGRYKRMPVDNDWHDVIITRAEGKRDVYVWQNRAGESWWLYGKENDPVLTTDVTNPYFDDDDFRRVQIEFVRDDRGNLTSKVKGLRFMKDLYVKVSDSTRPD